MNESQGYGSGQSAVFWPSLLTLKHIVKLTDAAQELFNMLYDLEKQYRRNSKSELRKHLTDLDICGLTVNRVYAEAEDYQPDEPDWCS